MIEAACTQRRAHRELVAAVQRLRDNHVGQVGEGNDEHEDRDEAEDGHQCLNVEARCLDERQRGRADAFVGGGMLGTQLTRDAFEIRRGLLACQARLEPAGDEHIPLIARSAEAVELEQQKDLGGPEEPDSVLTREDADDGVRGGHRGAASCRERRGPRRTAAPRIRVRAA